MSPISFSGLSSGLDTSSWVEGLVSVKQIKVTQMEAELAKHEKKQSTVTGLQTAFNSLRTSIEKLTDAKFGNSFDIFSNNKVSSSDEKIFTATVGKNAARQNYDVKVEKLATGSVAASKTSVGAAADDDTKLSSLGLTEGVMSVYVDGVKHEIEVEKDDTVADLKASFNDAGIDAELNNKGKLSLTAQNDGAEIFVGATNDTSNMKSLLGLSKQDDGTYSSTTSLYQVSAGSKITEEGIFSQLDESGNPTDATVTKGTFTIGDAEFTIGDNTTITGLVNAINSNEDAGVSAYWDNTEAKLVLTSKEEGQSYVNIEAGTSNFTDVMGFTKTTRDTDGNIEKSALVTDNQELGENAVMYINGSKVTSASNTVTSDISRLEGVTINLKGVNDDKTPTSKMKVEQDSSQIVDAVNDFVEQYNSVMTELGELTSSGGELSGESSLRFMEDSLRKIVSSGTGVDEDTLTMLSQIGISTAKAGASMAADTKSLKLDEDALVAALEKDPDAVKKLLMGSSGDDSGVFSKLEKTIDDSLSSNGYFSIAIDSIQEDMTKEAKKIDTENMRIAHYKSSLEAQFQAMEKTIADMQSAYKGVLQ